MLILDTKSSGIKTNWIGRYQLKITESDQKHGRSNLSCDQNYQHLFLPSISWQYFIFILGHTCTCCYSPHLEEATSKFCCNIHPYEPYLFTHCPEVLELPTTGKQKAWMVKWQMNTSPWKLEISLLLELSSAQTGSISATHCFKKLLTSQADKLTLFHVEVYT